MPDDLTIGELGRRLDAGFADLKDDLRELSGRLDGKVSSDVFKLEQASQDARIEAMTARLTAIETARKEEDRQRGNDRRLLFTALIAPFVVVVLGIVVQVLLSVAGVL